MPLGSWHLPFVSVLYGFSLVISWFVTVNRREIAVLFLNSYYIVKNTTHSDKPLIVVVFYPEKLKNLT